MERGQAHCPVTVGTSLPWGGLTRPASKRRPPEVPFVSCSFWGAILRGATATSDLADPECNLQAATMVQNVILVFFRRRLSQRPAVEELERRNILKRE